MALPFEGNPLGFIIGNTPINLNAYALFQLDSTTKGMVTPRMNTAQMNAIPATFKGIEIFNTDTNTKWFTNGTIWVELTGGGGNTNWRGVSATDPLTPVAGDWYTNSVNGVNYYYDAVRSVWNTNGIIRVTQVQRIAIISPPTGMLVYQIDAVIGFYFYDGVGWRVITARRNTLASGAYNILTTDTDIANTANGSTFTLPASSVGQEYAIWVGNYTGFTLAANGLELIMGESIQSLDPWTMITVKCFVVGEWLVGR